MEKLIKLLNEFENTDNWENGNQVEFRESKIISKKFGFIQRLVENDKIDFENNKLQVLKDLITNGNQIYDFEVYSDYDSLLMLLSIQDNPTEFLISILK